MPLPLIAVATALLPDLIRLVVGDKAGRVADAAATAVQVVTGTDDPAAARSRLDADPAAASALRVRLAEIAMTAETAQREAEARERAAHLADLANARGSMTALAGAGSALAWGPAVVSVVVVLAFAAFLAMLLTITNALPPDIAALLNVAFGALAAAFAAVVNFWLGSSQGSREKDRILAAGTEAATALTTARANAPPPPAPVPLAPVQPPAVVVVPASAQPGNIAPPAQVAPDAAVAEARFNRCLDLVLAHEGGWSDHPADPGGATNMGITLRTLRDWRDDPDLGPDAVRALTRAEAREVYRSRYWGLMRCDDLPAGVDLMVFNFGVNAGPGRAVKLLQRLVAVTQDGSVGPMTLAAVRGAVGEPGGAARLVTRYAEGCMEHYRGLGTWATFGRGWTRRTEETTAAALRMAGQPATALADAAG